MVGIVALTVKINLHLAVRRKVTRFQASFDNRRITGDLLTQLATIMATTLHDLSGEPVTIPFIESRASRRKETLSQLCALDVSHGIQPS